MIYKSFTFSYEKNGKYQQQLDFKYFNNRQCKNITLHGCERKKLGLHLLKVMAALPWPVTGTTLNPKETLCEEIPWKIHTCVTAIQSKTWKKLCPCQIKNYSRRG